MRPDSTSHLTSHRRGSSHARSRFFENKSPIPVTTIYVFGQGFVGVGAGGAPPEVPQGFDAPPTRSKPHRGGPAIQDTNTLPRHSHQRLRPIHFVDQRLFSQRGVSDFVAQRISSLHGLSKSQAPYSKEALAVLEACVAELNDSPEAREDPQSFLFLVNEANAIRFRWNQALGPHEQLPLAVFLQSPPIYRAPDVFPPIGLFTTVGVTAEVASAMQTLANYKGNLYVGDVQECYTVLKNAVKTIRNFPGRWKDAPALQSSIALLNIANDVVRHWQAANVMVDLPPFTDETAQRALDGYTTASAPPSLHQPLPARLDPTPWGPMVTSQWPSSASPQRIDPSPVAQAVGPCDEPALPSLDSLHPGPKRLSLPTYDLRWPSTLGPLPHSMAAEFNALVARLNEPWVDIDRASRKLQIDGLRTAFQSLALTALRAGRHDAYQLIEQWAVRRVNDMLSVTTRYMGTPSPRRHKTARAAGLLDQAPQALTAFL